MKRNYLLALTIVMALVSGGCTFAKYSKVQVKVVDERTQEGIPKARVRVFYIKPMFDMTYQRKDRKKTDQEGFTTLTVATNQSQRMLLGWTYGIFPNLSVKAKGYREREIGVPENAFGKIEPLLIQMTSTNGLESPPGP